MMDRNSAIRVGEPAPLFSMSDLYGKKVSLESLKGKVVLMDFSSIFCGSCQETIKEFKRLDEAYDDSDLELIMVTDGRAPLETLKNFFEGMGAGYSVLPDREYRLWESYGVDLIPYQVLIDREGMVFGIHTGYHPKLESILGLKKAIRKAGSFYDR